MGFIKKVAFVALAFLISQSAVYADITTKNDFSGNGYNDLVWHDYFSGAIKVWEMQGIMKNNEIGILSSSNTNLVVKAFADFNNDNNPDILVHNSSTGNVRIWTMNGTVRTDNINILSSSNTNLRIIGAGDFNGDNNIDIAVHNKITGALRIWLMDGNFVRTDNISVIESSNTNLLGQAVGDLNADGKPDILLHNSSTGNVRTWLMDGMTRSSNELVAASSNTNLKVRGVLDIDADGKDDILWANRASGKIVLWKMDGVVKDGVNIDLGQVPDLAWDVGAGDGSFDVDAVSTIVSVNSQTNATLPQSGGDYYKLTLSGEKTIYIYTSGNVDTYGYIYTDSGTIVAENNNDGLDNNFYITDTLQAGTYYIKVQGNSDIDEGAYTLNISDLPGDTVSPVISIIGQNPVTILQGLEYIDKGATASDNVDGSITDQIITVNIVNTAIPGTYSVTYNVSDAAGNPAEEQTRTVIVEADNVAPVITLLVDEPQEIPLNGTYVERNATAIDNVDGDISANIVIDASAINTSVPGDYSVTYNVTDTAGNSADEVIRTVTVLSGLDTTDPVITLNGDNPQTVILGHTYIEANATAIDNVDGDISANIVIDASAVNTSEVGVYAVTYNVADSAENDALQVSRAVFVTDILSPPEAGIIGTALACDSPDETNSTDAVDFNASLTEKRNTSSSNDVGDIDRRNPTAHNTPERFGFVLQSTAADNSPTGDGDVHPIIVSYVQQVKTNGLYETGLGSADIGDPDHVDGVFVSLSRDNGNTWKKIPISNTSDRSSMDVNWSGEIIEYPGHAQKPTMAVEDNRIVVAWNDKFCPSGNPLNLTSEVVDNKTIYPDDYFAMNGPQNSIDYGEINDTTGVYEPYYAEFADKYVYEVPFSCVWTARGIIDKTTGDIEWHSPMQLTTGSRDTNKIWLEGSGAGFAMTWQGDTVGLKAGKGAGPGEGWSGATTGHGTDIWYTSIKMEDFEGTDGVDVNDTEGRLKSAHNFHYPVRMTDNEQCSNGETEKKPYCQYLCDTYGYETSYTNNERNETKERCLTYDWDMLDDRQAVMDADTGASRPALKILKTDAEDEYVVIFGYEETKGLALNETGVPDSGSETDISVEGKAVYFESFRFDAIDDFNGSKIDTIQDVAMPLVSAGNIVNVKAPEESNPGNMIYENARRLVFGTQIDACDADMFTFGFMYKQSFEVEGASSDMFIRVNNGFTYESFIPLHDANSSINHIVTNVSAQAQQSGVLAADYNVSWAPDNLDDNTYDNPYENTFSPRIFLRGNTIYTGFEYKPEDRGNMPANFHAHIYDNGAWRGPENITQVIKESETTVDARFFTTPRGDVDSGLESDLSNPDVLFVTWGNLDFIDPGNPGLGKAEGDLFYKRSTDNGLTWEDTKELAALDGSVLMEKEVESFASADGKTIYNVWLQETEEGDFVAEDPFTGVNSWFGRVDYDINNTVAPVPAPE